jgi:uncharacterized membrane protein
LTSWSMIKHSKLMGPLSWAFGSLNETSHILSVIVSLLWSFFLLIWSYHFYWFWSLFLIIFVV